jgi:hypothetical protein
MVRRDGHRLIYSDAAVMSCDLLPRESGGHHALSRCSDDAAGDEHASGNGAAAELRRVVEPQNLSGLPHGQAVSGHRASSLWIRRGRTRPARTDVLDGQPVALTFWLNPAAISGARPRSGRLGARISGRIRPEWVAAFDQNTPRDIKASRRRPRQRGD